MKKSARRGIGAIEIVIIVAIALGIVGLVWYALKGKSPSTPKVPEPPKTSVSILTQGSTQVSVIHPKEWSISKKTVEESGWTSKKETVKSPKGHYLHLFNSSGVGGDCQDDTYEYTLVKKIPTQSPDIYFTEYQTNAPGYTQALRIEDFKNRATQNTTQNEGDKGTNVCRMQSYSAVGKGAENSVFVTLSSKETPDLSGDLKYSDIESDTEFVAMLQSLLATQ